MSEKATATSEDAPPTSGCASDVSVLSELVKNQLTDVPSQHKLKISDMMRIADRVSSSVFNPCLCSVWLSYVSNITRPEKGVCINFFFKGRKVLLHRLLYINYVCADFDSSYYLKRKCRNYECVNVSHYYSVKYQGEYRNSGFNDNRVRIPKQVEEVETPRGFVGELLRPEGLVGVPRGFVPEGTPSKLGFTPTPSFDLLFT